ncbi:hypothetical protein [Sphingomonas radiodurans]|uniref:hypothetical protein n=1 Tax=Sphingomonas radiodurans TaxID=2890321 RepID=UPI001E37893F|nr:hypothetical protein [Sphingomonas radiodurans]WBH15871.1 hypothetical protein LLW23_13805 [Sphingomonas radiodurans]
MDRFGTARYPHTMPNREPPRLNRHGREIWFKEAGDENGYAPIHRKGWMAFVLGFVWIMVCAGISVSMVLLWAFFGVPLLIAFVVPFVVAVLGLLALAITVRRHS